MDEPEEFRCGTPSIDEWRKCWKSSPLDSNVTDEEYTEVWEVFETKLDEVGIAGYWKGCDFYFRGDNFGDRTQYLEIVNPDILKMEKLLALQSWLRIPKYAQWRILILSYTEKPSPGIIIYPNAIVVGQPAHELTKQELRGIASKMKESRAKDEQ